MFEIRLFNPPERLETSSFIVRAYRRGDGPRLSEGINASYDHLKVFMSWVQPHHSVEASEEQARRSRGRFLLMEGFPLGIFSLDESVLLGGCGYHLREGPLEDLNAEIGMWIRSSHAGRGLGTEVLIALLQWGFSAWPFERLSWRCDARNTASRRVAAKAGMAQEGVLRGIRALPDGKRGDTVCFGALRAEWRAPRACA